MCICPSKLILTKYQRSFRWTYYVIQNDTLAKWLMYYYQVGETPGSRVYHSFQGLFIIKVITEVWSLDRNVLK